ncbi:MAG: HipA domain-containing protein [bacterium]
MSIPGVLPQLCARLNSKKQQFEIVTPCGPFILKPQSFHYKKLPENDDLTMRMAAASGIKIPFHGLLYSKDGSRTYFIKRFDRKRKRGKLAVKDFAQLPEELRGIKYNYSTTIALRNWKDSSRTLNDEMILFSATAIPPWRMKMLKNKITIVT